MRRGVGVTVGLFGVAVVTAGLAWFQPWKLWTDHRVDDPLPAVAVAPHAAPLPSGTATPTRRAQVVARGDLISHEHETHGRVSVVEQADGSRVLAIADLRTSDGPDVHVWLTDAPVRRSERGWYVFDDGAHVSLGTLKGNLGNQVYRVPASADLGRLTSVSVWCDRFDVSFGAAELVAVS